MDQLSYFLFRIIKFGLLFYILFLIFTNFGTFLLIVIGFILAIYFFIYSKIKKIKKQAGGHSFNFKFTEEDLRNFQNAHRQGGFNQGSFHQGGFGGHSSLSEVQDAKDFFGFTQMPTEMELKKKYRELAKKYHPDINDSDDTMMQKLNHYKDVLSKSI